MTDTPPRVVLPQRSYKGYIFDLDGTLVDSMGTHFRAWRQALRENGAPSEAFLWEEFVSHGGMAAPDIVAALNRAYGLHMDPQATAARKRACYAEILSSGRLPVIEETVGLVRRLRGRGIPYAIGTGSVAAGARHTLQAAGIEGLFPLIVTPDDVPPGRGKPAPDIFLLAAGRMGVAPGDCVVFEDAEPGLQAAAAAGMDSVRVAPAPPVRD